MVENVRNLTSSYRPIDLAFSSNLTPIVGGIHNANLPVLTAFLERGVMFYTNAMANADNGARKKIHGGSGTSGNGDAYGPGSAFPRNVLYISNTCLTLSFLL